MQPAATYYLGADEAERARLLAQCELHRREAARLLDRVGVAHGARVLDVVVARSGRSTFSAQGWARPAKSLASTTSRGCSRTPSRQSASAN